VALEAGHDVVEMLTGDQYDGLLDHVVAMLVVGDVDEIRLQFLY
jgi:hypothetical protein